MSVPPESIEPGKCYLTTVGEHHRVQRVVSITPSGHVVFEVRRKLHDHAVWTPDERSLRMFAAAINREVPCDWTPEADEGDR
jgi:hypothetical protein